MAVTVKHTLSLHVRSHLYTGGPLSAPAALPLFLVITTLAYAPAYAENLLVNPSFEQVVGETPGHWKLFVMPQEGADGRPDEQMAFSGRYSAMLQNTLPYEKEPANNWSQTIMGDLAGKELAVRGYIRTQDATEAALWIQCWRSRPSTLLREVTTSDVFPLYGTMDWTPVEMRVRAPRDTDFVLYRCVLKGTGTAWFDDLVLEEKTARETTEDTDRDKTEPEQEEVPVAERQAFQSLIEANRVLVETSRLLRESNEALAQQLKTLQDELKTLRERLTAIEIQPPSSPEVPRPIPPATPVPPLVPRGYPLEGAR